MSFYSFAEGIVNVINSSIESGIEPGMCMKCSENQTKRVTKCCHKFICKSCVDSAKRRKRKRYFLGISLLGEESCKFTCPFCCHVEDITTSSVFVGASSGSTTSGSIVVLRGRHDIDGGWTDC